MPGPICCKTGRLCCGIDPVKMPQVGVATIAAAVQRAGGSLAHPGTALDEALEQKAASIEGNSGPEASSLGVPHSGLRL